MWTSWRIVLGVQPIGLWFPPSDRPRSLLLVRGGVMHYMLFWWMVCFGFLKGRSDVVTIWWHVCLNGVLAMIVVDPDCMLNLTMPWIVDDTTYSSKSVRRPNDMFYSAGGILRRIRWFVSCSLLRHGWLTWVGGVLFQEATSCILWNLPRVRLLGASTPPSRNPVIVGSTVHIECACCCRCVCRISGFFCDVYKRL